MVGDIGGPEHYHVGDEAIFSACVDWVKEALPECQPVATSKDPRFTSQNLSIESFSSPEQPRKPLSQRSVRKIRLAAKVLGSLHRRMSVLDWRGLGRFYASVSSASVLYICGGGNLTSRFGRELRLRSVMARLALDRGVPVILSGQTLGPKFTEDDRALMRSWLHRAEFLGVRDNLRSPAIALELGVDEKKICVHPDDAYSLSPRKIQEKWFDGLISKRAEAPLIGVSFHYRSHGRASSEDLSFRLAKMLDLLMAETSAEIVFLPHVTSAGREAYDVAFGRAVEKRLSSRHRFHLPASFLTDREVKYLTGCCDFVLSTRYHGIVFALSSGVPCVGFVQDDHTDVKMRGAFALSGVPEFVVDVADPGLDRKVQEFWERRAVLQAALARNRERIENGIESYRTTLAQVVRKLIRDREASLTEKRDA